MLRMSRRVNFSAAHALWIEALSPERNRSCFGPAATPEPHGHNYVLDITVQGRIDPRIGIIVNIKEIDRIIRERFVSRVEGRLLNSALEAFRDCAPTAENLTACIVRLLGPAMPPLAPLVAVRLEETPLHYVTWQVEREEKEMLLTRKYEFAASHRLHSPFLTDAENRELFGKCNYAFGHGHNYVLEVTVSGPVNPCSGQILPIEQLDAVVHREVVDRYDHRHFNHDVPDLQGMIPSTEVVTQVIWERLVDKIPAPARLERVLLQETERNRFEYRGEELRQS